MKREKEYKIGEQERNKKKEGKKRKRKRIQDWKQERKDETTTYHSSLVCRGRDDKGEADGLL